jgi:hypothetical protein
VYLISHPLHQPTRFDLIVGPTDNQRSSLTAKVRKSSRMGSLVPRNSAPGAREQPGPCMRRAIEYSLDCGLMLGSQQPLQSWDGFLVRLRLVLVTPNGASFLPGHVTDSSQPLASEVHRQSSKIVQNGEPLHARTRI